MTDDERRELNATARLLLTGDDGKAIAPDGTERPKRLDRALTSNVGLNLFLKWKTIIYDERIRSLPASNVCPRCGMVYGIVLHKGYDRYICKEHGLAGIPGESVPFNDSFEQWAWNNRHGQPWQADIEAHVAAYVREAPDYAGDIALADPLIDEIARMGLTVEVKTHMCSNGKMWHCCSYINAFSHAWEYGETRPIAITKAFVAVALAREEKA
jgi:hypothetical protein